MSSRVSGTTIKMTRGDTLNIKINITKDGDDYIPQEDDVIRFALKKDYTDVSPLLVKEISNDDLILKLEPADTKSLAFDTYVYDIQITFADGAVDTFIDKAKLKITEEVE